MNSPAEIEARLGAITNYLRLSPALATAGQPTREQFADVAAAGFRTVINLALPTSTNALPDEPDIVARHGMDYVHIPVVWEAPRFEDFARFADAMRARVGRPTFVHCAMNLRVSAFMFLYRTLVDGVAQAEAASDLHRIWTPDEVWPTFIADVQQRWPKATSIQS